MKIVIISGTSITLPDYPAVAGIMSGSSSPGDTSIVAAHGPHQVAMEVALEEVARDVSREASSLTERKPSDLGRVVRNRYVMHNAPVVSGTRVPTIAIWNFQQAGYSTEQILNEYPRLTPVDVDKAISFERGRNRKRRAG